MTLFWFVLYICQVLFASVIRDIEGGLNQPPLSRGAPQKSGSYRVKTSDKHALCKKTHDQVNQLPRFG